VAHTGEVNSVRDLELEVRMPSEAVELEGITVEVEVLFEEERTDWAQRFTSDYMGSANMASIADRVYDFADPYFGGVLVETRKGSAGGEA